MTPNPRSTRRPHRFVRLRGWQSLSGGARLVRRHCVMNTDTTSWFRVVALATGYVVAVVGVLSIFTIPFYASLVLMAVGTVIALLSDRANISMTRSSWIVLLAGCILILCVLALFGENRVRHWTPFPAGYIPAWFGCFNGFRQVRHLILYHHRHEDIAA